MDIANQVVKCAEYIRSEQVQIDVLQRWVNALESKRGVYHLRINVEDPETYETSANGVIDGGMKVRLAALFRKEIKILEDHTQQMVEELVQAGKDEHDAG